MLETYKMFAYDEGWSRRINEAIDSGLTAEAAIERVQQRTRARMREIDDPLLKERMHDLEDLSNRLMRIVSGRMGTAAQTGLDKDAILIARNLGPAELLEYDKRRLKGVVLEEGSLTAHMTIVARAMGVPVVGRVADIRHIASEGDVDPGRRRHGRGRRSARAARMITSFEQRMATSQKPPRRIAALRDLAVESPPTAQPIDADGQCRPGRGCASGSRPIGADGIGLFRTEFQFLISATLPGPRKPAAALPLGARRRRRQAGGVPHGRYRRRQGAALSGRREGRGRKSGDGLARAAPVAVALGADEGAGARADRGRPRARVLRVMFPMISEPWEYEEARALFEEQLAWAQDNRRPVPSRIEFGAMLEVPSLAEMLDVLLPRIDFLSIGTNDLTQFLFAADRADPRLAERYDWLSPAILRFLRRIVVAADAAGVPVRLCGEMGGRPLEAMALIGIGIDNFSITPAAIGPVKAMVRSLDARRDRAKMAALLAKPTARHAPRR